mmetsp:Transcript_47006/g.87570  ORF Transcript_47006/g.87570 Transcript_47006/m.87570 type:complete len:104 (+) Transcript_47006:236-547(+)
MPTSLTSMASSSLICSNDQNTGAPHQPCQPFVSRHLNASFPKKSTKPFQSILADDRAHATDKYDEVEKHRARTLKMDCEIPNHPRDAPTMKDAMKEIPGHINQ